MYDYPPRARKLMLKILEKRLTMEGMASKIGLSRVTMSRKLKGDCKFSKVHVDRLHQHLGLTHDEMYYFFSDKNRDDSEIHHSRIGDFVSQ